MLKTLTVVLLPVLLASCATERHVTHMAVAPRAARYAVTQNIEREVQNAKDAGEGDYVARELRQRLILEPDNVQVRLDLAAHLLQSGHSDLALEHYRVAAEKFPDNADVALHLAKTLRGLGQSGAASETVVNFCKRHQSAPPELLSFMGVMLDDSGRFTEAETAYRTALQSAPNAAYLHNNLGFNLLQQNRASDAVPEFRRALELDPQSEIANNNLATALLAGWQSDAEPREALKRWESASDAATAHNNFATYLMEHGRYKDARQQLDIALRLNHNHAAALRNQQLLARLERPGGAPAADGATVSPGEGDDDLVTLWKRFTLSLQKVFTTTKDQPKAANTASK